MLNANHLTVNNLSAFAQTTKNSLHHLRFNTFKTHLGWDVPVTDNMEIDEFDRLDPVFIVAKINDQVEGCLRLLPTTGKYMLKDTFPQLLNGEPAPIHINILEISRYAVNTQ
jgi:N-acyl-L-homoserine lactone synthetase